MRQMLHVRVMECDNSDTAVLKVVNN